MRGKSRNTKARTADSDFINDASNDDNPIERAQKANPNVVTNGKRKRVASAKQGSIDDDANEKRLARLARLKKENKKMKVKLLKASKEAAKNKACLEDSDDSDNSLESEDAPEVDQPVRFSSSMEHLRRSYTSKPLANHKPHNAAERALLRLPIGLTHHLAMMAMTQPLVVENMVERALLHLQVPIGLTHYLVTMAMTQPLMDGNVVEQAPLHLPIGLMHHLVMMVTTQPGHLVDGNMVEFEQDSHITSNQKRFKTPQIHAGVLLSSKPKVSDYEDVVKRRLLEAMSIYETYIFTDRAYPTQELQFKRIKEAWGFASADAEEQYELTNRMLCLVKDRGPRARGFLKDITRPHIEKAFGFTPSTNKKVVQKNVDRYLELMEGRIFHYKDPATKTGFAENAIIKKVLREAFFRRKDDRGITHANSFSPIPLALIALILTAVEHCIEEWSTGMLVKANFEESTAAPLYDAHLEKLQNWHELNPTVVDKILETLFKRCSRPLSAATGGDSIPAMTDAVKEAARKELEARTGETESDSDA
ncbi:hypothetical protein V8E52_011613 [Russula decolorans]